MDATKPYCRERLASEFDCAQLCADGRLAKEGHSGSHSIDCHRKNRNLTQTLDLAAAAELASEEMPLPKLSKEEDALPILPVCAVALAH